MHTLAQQQNLHLERVSRPPQPAATAPIPGRPGPAVHGLQRAVGNQAVMRMLRDHADAVVPASPMADRAVANAVTVGRIVHLAPHLPDLPREERQRILAHEAVHVAQQSGSGPAATRAELEAEADRLAPGLVAGATIHPRLTAGAIALADDRVPSPRDRLDVARAMKRREVLLRYKDMLEGGKASLDAERSDVRDRRLRLDQTMAPTLDLLLEAHQFGLLPDKPPTVDRYRQEEQTKLAGLNLKPVTVVVTPTAVRLLVRFQVRFEGVADQQAQARFPLLERNFRQAVKDTWDQQLPATMLGGRAFEVVPELQLVSATAPRDPAFWLITVRPTDTGPLVYEGQSLGVAPGGVPTSVTDPLVDGGVMSIPPSHLTKPDVLGHETLHLFAMVDRYILVPAALSKSGKPGEQALREIPRRRDPLGGQGGKILQEDLGFAIEAAGVYKQVASATSPLTEGMTYSEVLAALHRVDEIIKLGRDPYSLIPERKDFRREVMKSAEDLD